jgi:cell division protein FtsX
MHPAAKVAIGIILILIGLALFVDEIVPGFIPIMQINWLTNFVIVLTGIIPILLIVIGLFIAWLEIDELKATKEIKEEIPSKKGKKRKK